MDQPRKLGAELLGTFTLVFVGSLAILAVNATQDPLLVPVALGFGLALLAGLYAFGEISGGHFNPAVSLGMFLNGRLARSALRASAGGGRSSGSRASRGSGVRR